MEQPTKSFPTPWASSCSGLRADENDSLRSAAACTITTPQSAGRCFALRSKTSSRSPARLRLRSKGGLMEELDFSGPAREPARAPAYDPEVALEFFRSAGKEVRTVTPGQIFGEWAAFSESPRSATALATAACRVISLDGRGFQAALRSNPEFSLMLMGTMIGRLRAMLGQLTGIPSAASQEKDSRVFDKGLLAALAEGLGDQVRVRYDRGSVIMVEGQAGVLMYVVLEGRVVITLRGAVLQYVGPGGVFGELALIDQSARAADATAETDCALLAINRNLFLNLVKSDPTFAVSLLSAVAERVRNMAASFN